MPAAPAQALVVHEEKGVSAAKSPRKAAKAARKPAPRLKPEAVLAWLQAHPQFLAQYAGQLAALSPKGSRGGLGGNLLSLHAAKANQAEKQVARLTTRTRQLVAAAQANAVVAHTIFSASLQALQLTSKAQLRTWLQTGLPELLGLNAARLLLVGTTSNATTLTEADLLALSPQPVTLRTLTQATERQLYGPKGKLIMSDALLRLDHPASGAPLGVVALGSTDATRFHAGQSTELASFLGQVLASRLSQFKA